MLKNPRATPSVDAEPVRQAVALCAALRRAAPNCFYRLYESDIHCVYAWVPRLRRHATSAASDAVGAVEACNDETCACRRLREIADRLSPR
jgi:hypothetical protein